MDLSAALSPLHQPPAGMEMDALWQPVMTFVQIVPVVLVVWWAYRRALPKEPLLVTACFIGGAVTCFIEPLVDHLALVWFAPKNMWVMFETFGRGMPWFILPCYIWYVGGQTVLSLYLFRRGIDMRHLFGLYGLYIVTNIVMEIPPIAAGIYTYYGPQPFEIAGLPLWFQSINAATPIVAGAVIYRMATRRGWNPLIAVAVIPGAHAVTNAAAGWPMWSALNSTNSTTVTSIVGLVTIGLAVLIVYLVGLVVTVPASSTMRHAEAPDEDPSLMATTESR